MRKQLPLPLLVPLLIFGLSTAPTAGAQPEAGHFVTGTRALLDTGRYEAAESGIRQELERVDLTPAEHATALDLLVESYARRPHPDPATLVPLAREAVAYRLEQFGADDPGLATSYRYLGIVLGIAGEPEAAATEFARAIEQVRRTTPNDASAVTKALNSLGVHQMRHGQYTEAVETFTNILAITEASDDTGQIAIYLENRAGCYRKLGEFALSEADLRHSIDARGALDPVDEAGMIHGLTELSDMLWETNRATEAIQFAEQALEIALRVLPAKDARVLDAECTLGSIYRLNARLVEARTHLERAVALGESTATEDPFRYGKAVSELASLESTVGDIAESIALQERALSIQIEAVGPDDPAVGVHSARLGEFLAKAGYYAEARRNFERCLRIDIETYGAAHPYVAGDRLNIAVVDTYAGDYAAADAGFRAAREGFAGALPEDHPQIALVDYSYAVLLATQGQFEPARARMEQAYPILEPALGPESQDLAAVLIDYGKILFELGDLDLAQARIERALAIQRAAFGESHPDIATSLGALANIEAERGNLDAAATLAEQALAMSEATRGPAHPWTGRALRDLAALRLLQDRNAEALDLALRAERIGSDHLRLLARGSSERQALAYAGARSTGLDIALAASLKLGDPDAARRTWNELVRSRALVLDEMAARHRSLAAQDDPGMVEQFERFHRARARVAALTVQGPGELPPDAYAKLLREAIAEKEQLEIELANLDAGLHDQMRAAEIGWAEVHEQLQPTDALVGYRWYLPAGGQARYAAFVTRGGQDAPVVVDLGSAEEIEACVVNWRSSMADPGPASGPFAEQSESLYRTRARSLRKLAWDPVVSAIDGADRVFVVSDRSLTLVNFNTLPDEDGGYLLDAGMDIHLLTTERDLPRLRERPEPQQSGSDQQLLAIGGINFDRASDEPLEVAALTAAGPVFRGASSGCEGFASLSFSPLPRSGPEANSVAERWAARGNRARSILLTGEEATEDRVKQLATDSRILHVATHGFFLSEECSDLQSSRDWSLGFSSDQTDHTPENPLLHSGLALAGANERANAAAGAEDGVLTAEEIASMDLQSTDWVVLSACDTGVGEFTAGEGVMGLRRSFEIAGARTLVTSLWPVEDRIAEDWMDRFYSACLDRNLGAAAAALSASRALLDERRAAGESTHPYYWAPFVASGDWN